MYLIFDTETTGLPRDYNAPVTDTDNWPRMVQLAWQLHGPMGELIEAKNFIVKPEGYDIPFETEKIHGISTERAKREGMELSYVLDEFARAVAKAGFAVGQNISFDIPVVGCEYYRKGIDNPLPSLAVLDTMSEVTANLCKIPGRGKRYKFPRLIELHTHLFGEGFGQAHNASADVEATARCFLELIRLGLYTPAELRATPQYIEDFRRANPEPIKAIGLNVQPYKPMDYGQAEADTGRTSGEKDSADVAAALEALKDVPYCHLHNHTQYSILQATTDVDTLVELAWKNKMPAVGLTDLGNMYGAFNLTLAIGKINEKIAKHNKAVEEGKEKGELWEEYKGKVIIGCELYVAEDYKRTRFTKEQPDRRFQQVLFAKNKAGYHNLAKLSTEANTVGLYGQYARVGRELIAQYRENLIATTGGLQGEVPQLILQVGERQAEEAFKWWLDVFGDDFYVELLRHGLPENDRVNRTLLSFAEKYGVRYIAQNNTFYASREDSNAHDILLCIASL